MNQLYTCKADNAARTIRVSLFKDTFTPAGEEFTFTVNSIRNPSVGAKNYNVFFKTISEHDTVSAVIDVGTFVVSNDKIVRGEIQ